VPKDWSRLRRRLRTPAPSGAAQGYHRELVTRVARKGNLPAHRRAHPHHGQEEAAVVEEVAVTYQNFDAHRARASSRVPEDPNEYDRALVEN
jgi:hypothetical protein